MDLELARRTSHRGTRILGPRQEVLREQCRSRAELASLFQRETDPLGRRAHWHSIHEGDVSGAAYALHGAVRGDRFAVHRVEQVGRGSALEEVGVANLRICCPTGERCRGITSAFDLWTDCVEPLRYVVELCVVQVDRLEPIPRSVRTEPFTDPDLSQAHRRSIVAPGWMGVQDLPVAVHHGWRNSRAAARPRHTAAHIERPVTASSSGRLNERISRGAATGSRPRSRREDGQAQRWRRRCLRGRRNGAPPFDRSARQTGQPQ